jgi:hypothetical protein
MASAQFLRPAKSMAEPLLPLLTIHRSKVAHLARLKAQ